jgi:biopolymer transport protein ExbB
MIDSLAQAYDFLSRGGPIMGILFLGSIACLGLVLERAAALRREKILPRRFLKEAEALARGRKLPEFLALCKATESPLARIIQAGLENQAKGPADMLGAMELAGRIELSGLERNMDFLASLAAAGPLLGLLGTVTGMIRTFAVVKAFGVGDPMRLSGGISEALLTTAGGLVVAIPAVVFHRYFLHRIDRYVLQMEEFSARVLGIVTEAE